MVEAAGDDLNTFFEPLKHIRQLNLAKLRIDYLNMGSMQSNKGMKVFQFIFTTKFHC